MGRPKAKEAKQQYTVMLRPSVVEEIDKIAGKLGLSRSQFMSNLLEMGLDDARLLQKAGLLKLFQLSCELGAKMKRLFFKGELEVDEHGELKFGG